MVAFQFGLQRVCLDDDGVAVGHVQHEERADVYILSSHLINLCRGSLIQQKSGFVAPVIEDSIQHEADHVAGEHRHLAGQVE